MGLKENYLQEYSTLIDWKIADQESFFKRMNKLIPTKESLSLKQMDFLKEISQTFLELDKSLEICRQYGLNYNIGLSGGAIRDFIMDKIELINDFDIIINFEEITINDYGDEFSFYKLDDKRISHINMKGLWNEFNPSQKLSEITPENLSELINKIIQKHCKTNLFLNLKGQTENYQNTHILGIIKTEDPKFSKPIDLIISAFPCKVFITTFSFDMCMGFIKFSPDLKEQLEKKENELILLEHIMLTQQMIHDIEKKEFTMNLQSLNETHVHYYMNKHYLKMKEKYPDFKMSYRVRFADYQTQEQKNILKDLESIAIKYILHEKIQEEAPTKNGSKKLKI